MEFRFEPIPAGTVLSTETRILATDPGTRRSFAAYWFLIRPSSSAIRREVLAVVARRAELSRSQNIETTADPQDRHQQHPASRPARVAEPRLCAGRHRRVAR